MVVIERRPDHGNDIVLAAAFAEGQAAANDVKAEVHISDRCAAQRLGYHAFDISDLERLRTNLVGLALLFAWVDGREVEHAVGPRRCGMDQSNLSLDCCESVASVGAAPVVGIRLSASLDFHLPFLLLKRRPRS